MFRTVKSDVLILGSGGAGLRAAIEARNLGRSVALVSKSPAGMNNATVVSGGGFRCAIGSLTPAEHLRDTVEVGKRLNDPALVKVFAEEGGERCLELKEYGVKIRERDGGISVGSIPQLPGLDMTKPMVDHCRELGVEFHDNVVVTRLLKRGDRVVGAVGFDVRGEEPVAFSAGSTVLATGGAGALYKRTDCPLRMTGDGYSLALHAGAVLRDMEFVQFFPLALAEPGMPPYLLAGPVTEEGKIVNGLGEDIPLKYGVTARPFALKSRDSLSRAMMREIQQGGGVDGAVLIDARDVFKHHSVEELTRSGVVKFLVERIKAAEKPFRVAPISHFCMGGAVIDVNGCTRVPGLFAAGEVVGGIHGANRHGGNALTDILVFGRRAAISAAEYAGKHCAEDVEDLASGEAKRISAGFQRETGYDPHAVMARLREVMWEKAGIIRSASSLMEAFEEVENLRAVSERVYAPTGRDMLVALELPMALDAAELIIRAAMARTESRGAHYRSDYPSESPDWLHSVYVEKAPAGSLRVW